MQLNLLVLRARDPQGLADFYGSLGLNFSLEKHGAGPEHMACDLGAGIFEIYPCSDKQNNTRSVRLGFSVDNLDARCLSVRASHGRLLRGPYDTAWGRRATIQDPEGHTVDLVEA